MKNRKAYEEETGNVKPCFNSAAVDTTSSDPWDNLMQNPHLVKPVGTRPKELLNTVWHDDVEGSTSEDASMTLNLKHQPVSLLPPV